MQTPAKKILFRILGTLGFCLLLLAGFLFFPTLLYAHQTVYKNYTIYHNQALPAGLKPLLDQSFSMLQASEIFDPGLQVELCLNDGSVYPKLVETILGVDLVRAFSHKSVLHGSVHPAEDVLDWRGKRLLFSQWTAHALTHNLQFDHHGLWDANPLGGHANWKWEGYAEYISLGRQFTLPQLWAARPAAPAHPYDWVSLDDRRGTTAQHLLYLISVKFCLETRKLTYRQLLDLQETEEQLLLAVQQELETSN